METDLMFLECPAYMDNHGEARCGLPAEIEHRYSVSSTDGSLDSAKIRCPRGHWFNGPLESLTWGQPGAGCTDPGTPATGRAFAAVAEGPAPPRTGDSRD
jgi:hypothetical protein